MFGFPRFRTPVVPQRVDEAHAGGCFHCGLALPQPVVDWIEFEGLQRPLCCASCHAAAGMLIAGGFGSYYHQRAATARPGTDAGRI